MRPHFESSRLLRLLGPLGPADAAAPQLDIAERLGQWLPAVEAVTLHAVHHSLQASAAGRPGAVQPLPEQAAAARALAGEIARVRAGLLKAIASAAPEATADYASFRQRQFELQRQMEAALEPLRAQARQAVARASPRLRQLAALDAVWDQLLAAREQRLLAGLPALLERRHAQLRYAAHAAQPAEAPAEAAPGWCLAFVHEWREALGAELEMRLQPAIGLLEAFNEEIEKT